MRPQRSKNKQEAKRLKMAVNDLYAQGYNAAEIAARIGGISPKGIEYWITKIRKEIAHRIANLDAEKAAQLESNRRIRTEAWQAWERSAQPEETTLAEKTTGDAKGEGTKTQVRRVGQAGDAAFLTVIEKANKADRDLLGLDAPTKHRVDAALSGVPGAPPMRIEASNVGDPVEFAARVAAILVDAGILPAGLPAGDAPALKQVGQAQSDAEAGSVPARSEP